jgi:hypothetical protein
VGLSVAFWTILFLTLLTTAGIAALTAPAHRFFEATQRSYVVQRVGNAVAIVPLALVQFLWPSALKRNDRLSFQVKISIDTFRIGILALFIWSQLSDFPFDKGLAELWSTIVRLFNGN